jgi:uncharacterized protein YdeI (YjbR/CyaY-like superfamily)
VPEPTDLPIKPFTSQKTFTTWLAKHHATSNGIWIKFAKKDSGIRSIVYAEAVEASLCYGWIDGQALKFDERYYLQRFTPRRAKSRWSKINRDKASALITSGAMRPAGLAEVERARADGRWDAAYSSPKNVQIPEELARAFARNAKARKAFETLDSRNRYAVLYRVEAAKKPETRTRLAKQFVEMLANGETPYPRPERKR